jgi:formylglycine-generating enzyme
VGNAALLTCNEGRDGWEAQSCGAFPCVAAGDGGLATCGVCAPGSMRCLGGIALQACQSDGQWGTASQCGPLEACAMCGPTALCVATSVAVTGGYAIDATEVSSSQYAAWIATNPTAPPPTPSDVCAWKTSYNTTMDLGSRPAVNVDWCDAVAYCSAVGKRLCGRIGGGANGWDDYADATKSQWYNACSSGGADTYPYADSYQPQTCNGYDNLVTGCGTGTCATEVVGTLTGCASPVTGYEGVYDLSGNVWEWEDSCNGVAGGSDSCRIRGGSYFYDSSMSLRCNDSDEYGRNSLTEHIGFRCCAP